MTKILGEPFETYVDTQIRVRQARLGQNQKTSDDLIVFNASTPWIRLSSSVSVGADRAKTLATNLGINKSQVVGNNLAKNLVLFAGSSEGAGGVQKGGLTYGGLKGAYGFLTDPKTQGYKPMPGITSISTNYKNNGSLKQAQVNLKCFSKGQFEAIETLYLRLGYTLTLEYGHSIYYDNDTKKQNMSSLDIPNALFIKSVEGAKLNVALNKGIVKNKEATGGNYDAIIAKVSNFSWSLNPDLSYDIVLDLISVGDIIDSLKMNLGGIGSTRSSRSQAQIDANLQNILQIRLAKNTSLLNAFLYELTERITSKEAQEDLNEASQKFIEKEDLIERAENLLEGITGKYTAVIDEQIEKYITPFETLRTYLLDSRTVLALSSTDSSSGGSTGIRRYTGAWTFKNDTDFAIDKKYEKLVEDLPAGRLKNKLLGLDEEQPITSNTLTFLNSLNLNYTPDTSGTATITTSNEKEDEYLPTVMSAVTSTRAGLEKVRNYINSELSPKILNAGIDSQGEVIPGQEAVNTVGEIAYLSIQSKTTEQIKYTLMTMYVSGYWDKEKDSERYPHKDLKFKNSALKLDLGDLLLRALPSSPFRSSDNTRISTEIL